MSTKENAFFSHVNGCLWGGAVGGLYGRFVEHEAWRGDWARRMEAVGSFPKAATGLEWGEYGIDFTAQTQIVSEAVLEREGLPSVEDLARVWMRSVEPLAFGDGRITMKPPANPIRYSLRNTYELLRMGTPPRMVGALNVPMPVGLCVAAPVATIHAHDPDEAYLRGAALASLFQRDRGTVVPGIVAAMAAVAMRAGVSVNEVAATGLRMAEAADGVTRPPADGKGAALMVYQALNAGRNTADREDLFQRLGPLVDAYGKRDPHKLLAQIVAVFVYSGGDYREAVETAVMEPQSPDILGACCGMLCGALRGEKAIPKGWERVLDGLRGGAKLRKTAASLGALTVREAQKRRAGKLS